MGVSGVRLADHVWASEGSVTFPALQRSWDTSEERLVRKQ
jgi:hypothetical protein